jgi:hypothetical protein
LSRDRIVAATVDKYNLHLSVLLLIPLNECNPRKRGAHSTKRWRGERERVTRVPQSFSSQHTDNTSPWLRTSSVLKHTPSLFALFFSPVLFLNSKEMLLVESVICCSN